MDRTTYRRLLCIAALIAALLSLAPAGPPLVLAVVVLCVAALL